MKLFACGRCGNRLFFENVVCNGCDAALGFDPRRLDLLALEPGWREGEPDGVARWRAIGCAPSATVAASAGGWAPADARRAPTPAPVPAPALACASVSPSISASVCALAPEAGSPGLATEPATAHHSEAASGGSAELLRLCANGSEHGVCNWLVPDASPHSLCVACRLNRTIPDLWVDGHLALWQTLETEKRRLVYALLRLALPVVPRSEDPSGLAFDFLAGPEAGLPEREPVLTGHHDGLITINIAEADPAERERMRSRVAEPYRTLLGHFRHESAHHFWERLVRDDAGRLAAFRARMGDERLDYAQALDRHYREGPPADWGDHFVSPYASSHPWEDWAETWAHVLLIIDTLETAVQYGLTAVADGLGTRIAPVADEPGRSFDAYAATDFAPLAARWLPMSLALNSLNRSMGHAHAYPFVLPKAVIAKLHFVHGVMRQSAGTGTGTGTAAGWAVAGPG
jgi:hypothetical protein